MKNYIFSQDVLTKLSTSTQRFFIQLRWHALLISVLTGAITGLTCTLIGLPFLAGFLPIFFFIALVFEPMMLSVNEVKPSMSNIVIRLVFGIVLSVLNSTGLELIIFQDDISNHFEKQNSEELAAIDSVYQHKAQPFAHKIESLQHEIDSLTSGFGKWTERLYTEINVGGKGRRQGDGKYTDSFRKLRKQDSLQIAPILAKKTTSIGGFENAIEALGLERKDQIEAIVDPPDRGLLERVKALQAILFDGQNTFMLVFYVSLLLMLLCAEMSTIIVRYKNPQNYRLYYDEQMRQIDEKKREVELEAKNSRDQMKQKLEKANEKAQLIANMEAEEEKARLQLTFKERLRDMVIGWISKDSEKKASLDEDDLKKLSRNSIKSHLNGLDDWIGNTDK